VVAAVCLYAGHPIILDARTEPYVFNDATFRKAGATIEDSFVSVTDKCEGLSLACSSVVPCRILLTLFSQVH
jgi:hypothetical protein